jgi:hypothetical protein
VPVLDSCHSQIVNALRKDGWNVSPKSPYILAPDMAIYVDIAARRSANGSGDPAEIYVEVKCLPGHNITQELYGILENTSCLKVGRGMPRPYKRRLNYRNPYYISSLGSTLCIAP